MKRLGAYERQHPPSKRPSPAGIASFPPGTPQTRERALGKRALRAYQVSGDQRGPRIESGRELLVDGLDLGEVQQFDQLVTTRLSFLWLPSKCTGRVCPGTTGGESDAP